MINSKGEENFLPLNLLDNETIEMLSPELEKTVKKTLTLPKWLNKRALELKINFSAVLKDALLQACEEKQPEFRDGVKS